MFVAHVVQCISQDGLSVLTTHPKFIVAEQKKIYFLLTTQFSAGQKGGYGSASCGLLRTHFPSTWWLVSDLTVQMDGRRTRSRHRRFVWARLVGSPHFYSCSIDQNLVTYLLPYGISINLTICWGRRGEPILGITSKLSDDCIASTAKDT